METLNIAITASLQAFSNYADELGYQSQIPNPDHVGEVRDPETLEVTTPAVGEPTIANPENKQAFLARSIKSIVATALADKAVRDIERTKRGEALTESDTLRKAIENAITIS